MTRIQFGDLMLQVQLELQLFSKYICIHEIQNFIYGCYRLGVEKRIFGTKQRTASTTPNTHLTNTNGPDSMRSEISYPLFMSHTADGFSCLQ